MSTLQDAMWRGESDRLQKARAAAREKRKAGYRLTARSIMLSAYITLLSGRLTRVEQVKYFCAGLWNALLLLRQWQRLNHNQLDVLLQFLLKVHPRLWSRNRNINQDYLMLLAQHAIKRAKIAPGKPHQLALAYMTAAQVTYVVNPHDSSIKNHIEMALALESAIRREADQPQGLRQLVRIYRKAGELYGSQKLQEFGKACHYLSEAYDLAQGEADAADQIQKIRAILDRIRRENS